MKGAITQRKQAARKAWKTRKEKEKHEDYRIRGNKAKLTRLSSELNYIEVLSKIKNINKKCIFHHEGLPDLMVITTSGKMKFYEIKPKKGARTRTMLNPNQRRAIKELLKHDYVEEVNLVKYKKSKNNRPVYDDPIKLTNKNITEHTHN